MLVNYFKLFKQTTDNNLVKYLLITELSNAGFFISILDYNTISKTLDILAVSNVTITQDMFQPLIKDILQPERIYSDSDIYKDFVLRLKQFKSFNYKDVTMEYETKQFKAFSKLYKSAIALQNIHDFVKLNNIMDPIYPEDFLEQTNKVPLNTNVFTFNLDEQYSNNKLDINSFKFKMRDRKLYEIITASKLYNDILKSINSPRQFSSNRNILLLGPAGGGKSQVVNAIAESLDSPYAAVVCHNRLDQDSFWSITTPVVDETTNTHKWTVEYTDVFHIVTNGGLVFLDEFNTLSHEVQIMWNNIIEGQKKTITVQGKTYKVADDLILFAAGNVAYQGTKPLNPATKSRFEQFYVPSLEREAYLKKVNTVELMKPHIANGNTSTFVNFLFKVKDDLQLFIENKRNVVEPPMIMNRQIDIFFDKLFAHRDFTVTFKQWIAGMFHSTTLEELDYKDFVSKYEVPLYECDLAFKSAYVVETPVQIKEEVPDTILDKDYNESIGQPIEDIIASKHTTNTINTMNTNSTVTPTTNTSSQSSTLVNALTSKLK
jgi:hypothetical protein